MIKFINNKSYSSPFKKASESSQSGDSCSLVNINLDDLVKATVQRQFTEKFASSDFDFYWRQYKSIPSFPAIGNINDYAPDFEPETHFIMKALAAIFIENALVALKYDTSTDPNLKKEPDQDNLGTAGRIAKIWGGNSLSGDQIREHADGRFSKAPRLAVFPNTHQQKNPITIKLDQTGMGSTCSHHFLPYSVTSDAKSLIVISYIPKEHLMGLSKIGRFVEWCLARPSLQEEATMLVHQKITEATGSDDVYVGLLNLSHTCEVTRGAKQYSTTTTEEYSGKFAEADFRSNLLKTVL